MTSRGTQVKPLLQSIAENRGAPEAGLVTWIFERAEITPGDQTLELWTREQGNFVIRARQKHCEPTRCGGGAWPDYRQLTLSSWSNSSGPRNCR